MVAVPVPWHIMAWDSSFPVPEQCWYIMAYGGIVLVPVVVVWFRYSYGTSWHMSESFLSQWTYDVIITSLSVEVATSFWRNNDIITSCARWDPGTVLEHYEMWQYRSGPNSSGTFCHVPISFFFRYSFDILFQFWQSSGTVWHVAVSFQLH